METNLSGKTIVVTGATSGIGLAAAGELVRQGANLIGIGRSSERCRAAAEHLGSLNPAVSIDFCVADLSLQTEVRRAAAEIRQIVTARGLNGLDGLINNAGTFTYWLTLTAEGFEMQWAVNYLAVFLLTHELLPLLQAAPTARVVTVSSDSHYNTRLRWEDIQLRRRYNGLLAYQQTKLAGVLFTHELNRRLGAQSSVLAFAADPGLVQTDIGLKGTPALVRWIWQRRRAAGVSPQESGRGVALLISQPNLQPSQSLYWKDGQPKKPSQQALDSNSARRLWILSEQMCAA